MPGPKMGPRPADFDEAMIKQSPTFIKWSTMENGQKMKYACREFIKGHNNDEERLMRRIMIARRNNIKDHETLKQARQRVRGPPQPATTTPGTNSTEGQLPPPKKPRRTRRMIAVLSDGQVEKEMDVEAVEKTRSYKAWTALPNGSEFVYNQTYVKGREGHDWLLRKNIWRRMRYRRENKEMVENMKATGGVVVAVAPPPPTPTLALPEADQAAVEAAVAAAESFQKQEEEVAAAAAAAAASPTISTATTTEATTTTATTAATKVHNPLEAAQAAALDAAAQLAAATSSTNDSHVKVKDESTMEPIADENEEVLKSFAV